MTAGLTVRIDVATGARWPDDNNFTLAIQPNEEGGYDEVQLEAGAYLASRMVALACDTSLHVSRHSASEQPDQGGAERLDQQEEADHLADLQRELQAQAKDIREARRELQSEREFLEQALERRAAQGGPAQEAQAGQKRRRALIAGGHFQRYVTHLLYGPDSSLRCTLNGDTRFKNPIERFARLNALDPNDLVLGYGDRLLSRHETPAEVGIRSQM